jgi:hypothetical protein
LGGLGQDGAVGRPCPLHRLQREQHAPFRVAVQVGAGGRSQLAGDGDTGRAFGAVLLHQRDGDTGRAFGAVLLHQREGRQTGRDQRGRGEDADQGAQAAQRAALQGGLPGPAGRLGGLLPGPLGQTGV